MSVSKSLRALAGVLVVSAAMAGVANAQVCIQLEVVYQVDLGVGTATDIIGTPFLLTGVRLGDTPQLPFSGSFMFETDGTVRLSWHTPLAFASGDFLVPAASSIVTIGSAGSTFETNGYGDGGPPIVLTGTAVFLTCPPPASELDGEEGELDGEDPLAN